jgi:hypothetical protein
MRVDAFRDKLLIGFIIDLPDLFERLLWVMFECKDAENACKALMKARRYEEKAKLVDLIIDIGDKAWIKTASTYVVEEDLKDDLLYEVPLWYYSGKLRELISNIFSKLPFACSKTSTESDIT